MHEMSIAQELIEQICSVAHQNNMQRVNEVILEIGILRLVIPEVMQNAFTAVTKDTVAEGAMLTMIEIPAQAVCNQCQQYFEPALDDYLCPRCRRADVTITRGNDIVLKTLSGEGVHNES